jgi:Flp pilus assembly protein TadG
MTSEKERGNGLFYRGRKGSGGRGERGSNLVEQSILLVFLLTLLFAIIDFGRALYTYHFVSSTAREASRWASVRGSTCQTSIMGVCRPTSNDLKTEFATNLSSMGMDPSKITFVRTWVVPTGAATTCAAGSDAPGCAVKVSVTYSYKFFFPFLQTAPVNMTSQSEMVITQ